MSEAGSLWGNGFIPSEASSLCDENEQIVMVVNILSLCNKEPTFLTLPY
jgi:hypothetical protein